MTRNIIKRSVSIAVCLCMALVLILTALPVKAAGYSVSAELIPGSVSAGERFVIRLEIGGGTAGETADVTVEGIGGLSGSDSAEVTFDENGSASFSTGSEDFSYSGSGSTSLYVTVGNESRTVRVSGFEKTEEDNEDDEELPVSPVGNLIGIKEGTPLPEIRAGESKLIRIPLANVGGRGRYAGKARITASLPAGIYFNSATSTQELNFNRTGENQTLELPLIADTGAESGIYPITLTSVYTYGGAEKEETMQVNLKVIGGSGVSEGELLIADYILDRDLVHAGESFRLTVYIRNSGSVPCENVKMLLDGLSTAGITVNGGMDLQNIGTVAPGQAASVTWDLLAAEGMISGNQMLDISVLCGSETASAKIFVPVDGKSADADGEGPAASKPRVVIDSYTFRNVIDGVVSEEIPSSVEGGKTFCLTLNLKNTSSFAAIENLKMTVSSAADDATGGVFTPANSSNTFFIANVGAGQTFTETIDLLVKADAPPKSYGLDVAVSYEAVLDDERVTIDDCETITIPVTQPDRFEVEEVNVWGPVMYGETIFPSISFVNKGKSSIYNLSIRVEGENFTTGEPNVYIGNVESGSGDYYEANLNPEMPGMVEGRFILSYEDAAGNLKELERSFSVEVQEMIWDEPVIDEPAMMEPEETGMPLWGWILIGAGGAAVIVIVLVAVRKAKKKKAALALEDDDYDD